MGGREDRLRGFLRDSAAKADAAELRAFDARVRALRYRSAGRTHEAEAADELARALDGLCVVNSKHVIEWHEELSALPPES